MSVLRSHYDTKRSAESPEYAWPDAIHDDVRLDGEVLLQMFETYVPTNPEVCAYDYHIASKGKHPEHKNTPNNFVYASWSFHDYFDGLKVIPKGTPPMLVG
jgi:hypothetical protein